MIQLQKDVAGLGWAKEQHRKSTMDDRHIDEEEEIWASMQPQTHPTTSRTRLSPPQPLHSPDIYIIQR